MATIPEERAEDRSSESADLKRRAAIAWSAAAFLALILVLMADGGAPTGLWFVQTECAFAFA